MSRTSRYWRTLLLVVLGCGAYLNALPAPAVFDDEVTFVHNTFVHQLWPPYWFWCSPGESPLSTRPLVALSFALNYAWTGAAPGPMRAVNLALQIGSACVVWAWLAVLAAGRPQPVAKKRSPEVPVAQFWQTFGPWCVAAIWLVHPLQTDAVTYITQRTELMSGLAILTVMWTAARSPDTRWSRWHGHAVIPSRSREPSGTGNHQTGIHRRSRPARLAGPTQEVNPDLITAWPWSRWHSACAASCLIGVGCKEIIAVAPLLVILADRAFRYDTWSAAWQRRWPLYLALISTWIPLAILMRLMPRGESVGFHLGVTPWQYLLTQCHAIPMYLRQSIWPTGLSIDHGERIRDSFLAAVPGGLLLLTLAGITIWGWFARPVVGFVGAWFFIILGPTSSIVPIVTEVAAERRMHLPLLSVIVAFVYTGAWALTKLAWWRGLSSVAQQRFAMTTTAAALLVFAGLTIHRNYDYRSVIAIWTDAVAKVSDNYRAHSSLAVARRFAGDLTGAEQAARHALRLALNHYTSAINLVEILDETNRHAEADQVIDDYFRNNPQELVGWLSYAGQRAVKLKRYADAERLFRRVLQAAPTDFTALNELGGLFVLVERYDEAIELAQQAIAIEPQNSLIRENLGLLLAQLGRNQEAAAQLREAVRLDPQRLDARAWLDEQARKPNQQ